MFGSGSGSARGSGSQVSGPCLHPTQFFWPHGGRRVFLSGSFTGWREHIPMAPTEGCPRVFQVVWNLTPGHHQYKFIVDGEWRHNELQPFIKGSCGCVNTIFLEGGPDMVPSIVIPESSNRSNMDVDVDVFAPVEAVPRFSRGDLDLTRHRISAFLSRVTAYELLPESGKVVALDLSLPVKQAFEILYEERVPMAPLWDFSRGQFVGVVSALDFILILRELGRHGSNLTEEQLETHTIAAWKEAKLQLRRPLFGTERSYPLRFVSAEPYESLKEVALKILQWKVATVPVVDSYSEDGSFPRLLHLATLSGILACICRHFKHSSGYLPILQIPVSEFPLGTWVPTIGQPNGRQLAMLRPNSSLADALSLLVQAEVSSIPIVDDNDSLLDIYSRSDITALARHRAYTQIRLDQISIHQALQFGQNENSPFGLFGGQRCQMCLRSDPLHKVMLRLASPGVRRIVVVEAGSRRVQGIISLSDVFRFLLG